MPAPVPPTGRSTTRRIAELDALRGLAALAVGLYHLTYFVPFMVPGAPQAAVRFWWGCYGVQLFFAISGFVILGTLERTPDLGHFARARAGRLLPEYWLAMAATATVVGVFGPERLRVDPLTWLCNLPMLQLWTHTPMVDGVYWSLTVEVGFYAAMALLWRLGGLRRIEGVVLGWLAVKALLAVVAAPEPLRLLLLTDHAPYFATGLVAWRLWTGARSLRQQLPVLAAIVAAAALFDEVPGPIAAVVPIMLLLAHGRLRRLGHPTLVFLGALSYPFYLLHGTIGYTIVVRLEAVGVDPTSAAIVALLAGGLLAWGMTLAVARLRRLRFMPLGDARPPRSDPLGA